MMKKDFYAECAALLGTAHDYSTFNDVIFRRDRITGALCGSNACRWFGRHPGNGRFPGFGTIRLYGATAHVALRHPIRVNRQFASPDAALAYLRQALAAGAAKENTPEHPSA